MNWHVSYKFWVKSVPPVCDKTGETCPKLLKYAHTHTHTHTHTPRAYHLGFRAVECSKDVLIPFISYPQGKSINKFFEGNSLSEEWGRLLS